MHDVTLYSIDGVALSTVQVPAFKTPPGVIFWGLRCFALNASGDYRETAYYFVPPPVMDASSEG